MSKEVTKLQQNAAEYYFAYRLQQEFERLGVSTTSTLSLSLEKKFKDYLNNTALNSFVGCVYQKNVDRHISDIASKWAHKFFGFTIDCANYAKQGRAQQVKSDVILKISNGEEIGISLKNYDKPKLTDIQVNSGTWASFPLNFLFDSTGMGTWTYEGIYFTSKPYEGHRLRAVTAIKSWAKNNNASANALVTVFKNAITRNELIKQKYVESPETEILTAKVNNGFKKDCNTYGNAQIDDMIAALQTIPHSCIKQRFLKMIGFGVEEVLCLWSGEYLDSITNNKLKASISRINNTNMTVDFYKHKKNIRFTAKDESGIILIVDIPFTYNKNGGWHNESTPRICSKSGQVIQPFHRRPEKAKEMNTSTNTWVRLKKFIK